jgi:hypothetical protein
MLFTVMLLEIRDLVVLIGQGANLSRNHLPTGRQVCSFETQPYYLIKLRNKNKIR